MITRSFMTIAFETKQELFEFIYALGQVDPGCDNDHLTRFLHRIERPLSDDDRREYRTFAKNRRELENADTEVPALRRV